MKKKLKTNLSTFIKRTEFDENDILYNHNNFSSSQNAPYSI